MSRTSPTQRSLKYLRKLGFTVAITERWNPWVKRKQDLFGWMDLLAIRRGSIIGVQTTTFHNRLARIQKIMGLPAATVWVWAGGKIIVHGWIKRKGHWVLVEEDITLDVYYNDA